MLKTEIIKDTDDNNVPYVELQINPGDPQDEDFTITFRKYPKRVFVAVEDNRENQSSGLDLEDCWIAPVVIIDKIYHAEFDPQKSFMKALSYLGEIHRPSDPEEQDFYLMYWQERYAEIETQVSEWRYS